MIMILVIDQLLILVHTNVMLLIDTIDLIHEDLEKF